MGFGQQAGKPMLDECKVVSGASPAGRVTRAGCAHQQRRSRSGT